jgi:1,2-diacylglycerol 3-alpha-glucosyltransferase
MYEDYTHYIAGGHLITPGMTKRYSRIFCNRVDTVIAPTNKTKNLLLDYGVIKPIEVIPTGLNFSVIDFNFSQRDIQDERVRLGIPSFAPLIVSIGRVAKEKSLDILISAMKTLVELVPDIRLLIIGDGPQLTELKGLSVRLGIRDRVIFAGARPWASIGKYYKMADLFASASITETQGLTYIEAMIAKTPVVARKDESIEGIIENDKTGYLFSMQSDLISAICRVINNKKNTKHVVKEAYNRVSHLRSDIFAKKVESLYLEQIANKILEKYQKISRA